MNRINVNINKYANNATVINHVDLNARILKFIFYAFGILALGYVFILGNLVTNIIERRTLEVEARELTNVLSSLELEYLEKGSAIDLEYSHNLGFKDTKIFYATRLNVDNVKLAKNVR